MNPTPDERSKLPEQRGITPEAPRDLPREDRPAGLGNREPLDDMDSTANENRDRDPDSREMRQE
jgi:hypothetical protein